MLLLLFLRGRRVQILLQHTVEPFHPQHAFSHGRQHLNVKRLGVHEFGQFFLNECQQHPNDNVGVIPFQEKEIHALIVQRHLLPPVDAVGIDDDITLGCLPENLCQPQYRKGLGTDDVFQHTARPHRGQLVHVTHHDEPGARDQRL